MDDKNYKEGWDVFDTRGNDGRQPLEIQRIDDSPIFKNDDEAILYVWNKAMKGSERHQNAIELIIHHWK